MNLFLRKTTALAAGAVSIMALCVLSPLEAIAGGASAGGSSAGGAGGAAALVYDPFAGDVIGEVEVREVGLNEFRNIVGPYLAVQQLTSTNLREGEVLEIYLEEGAVVASNLLAVLFDSLGYVLSFYDDDILVSIGVLPDPESANAAQRTAAPLLPVWIRVIFEPHKAY